jgi:hypothetical protein
VFNMTITPAPLGAGGVQGTALPSATPWPSYGPAYVLGTPKAEVDGAGLVLDIGSVPTAFSGKLSNGKWQYISFTSTQEGSMRVTMTPYPGSLLDLYCGNVPVADPNSGSFTYRWWSTQSFYRQEVLNIWAADPYYQPLGGNASVRYYCRIPCSSDGSSYSLSVSYLGEIAAPDYGFPGTDLPSAGVVGMLQTVGTSRFRQYRYRPTIAGTWSVTAQTLYGGVTVYVWTQPFMGSISSYNTYGNPTATMTAGSWGYQGAGGTYYIAVSTGGGPSTYNLTITPPAAGGAATEMVTATPWPSNPAYVFGSAVPGLTVTGTIFDLGSIPAFDPTLASGASQGQLYISSFLTADQWHYFQLSNNASFPGAFQLTLTPYPGGNVDLYVGLTQPATPMTTWIPNARWSSTGSYWQSETITIYPGDPSHVANATYFIQVVAPRNDIRYTLRVQYIGESSPPAYDAIGSIANADGGTGGPLTPGTLIQTTASSSYRQYRYRAPAAGTFSFSLTSLYQSTNLYISTAPFTTNGLGGSFVSGGVGQGGSFTLTVATTSNGYLACGGTYYLAVLGTGGNPSTFNLSLTQGPTGSTCSYPTPSPVPSPAAYAYATIEPTPSVVSVVDMGVVPSAYGSTLSSGQWRYFTFRNAVVS